MAAAEPVRGRLFLNGPAELALSELAELAGPLELIGWLPEAPTGLGVPMLVDWLADRWHQPSAELLEQLSARGQGALVPDEPSTPLERLQAARRLQEAPPPPAPHELPPRDPAALQRAREALEAAARARDTTQEGQHEHEPPAAP